MLPMKKFCFASEEEEEEDEETYQGGSEDGEETETNHDDEEEDEETEKHHTNNNNEDDEDDGEFQTNRYHNRSEEEEEEEEGEDEEETESATESEARSSDHDHNVTRHMNSFAPPAQSITRGFDGEFEDSEESEEEDGPDDYQVPQQFFLGNEGYFQEDHSDDAHRDDIEVVDSESGSEEMEYDSPSAMDHHQLARDALFPFPQTKLDLPPRDDSDIEEEEEEENTRPHRLFAAGGGGGTPFASALESPFGPVKIFSDTLFAPAITQRNHTIFPEESPFPPKKRVAKGPPLTPFRDSAPPIGFFTPKSGMFQSGTGSSLERSFIEQRIPLEQASTMTVASSIESGNQHFVDMGLSMGRGFRVGWGPQGLFAAPNRGTSLSFVSISKVNQFALPSMSEESIKASMSAHLESSMALPMCRAHFTLPLREDESGSIIAPSSSSSSVIHHHHHNNNANANVPGTVFATALSAADQLLQKNIALFSSASSTNNTIVIDSASSQRKDDNASSSSNNNNNNARTSKEKVNEYTSTIWKLVKALWGTPTSNINIQSNHNNNNNNNNNINNINNNNNSQELIRRVAFSKWAQEVLSPVIADYDRTLRHAQSENGALLSELSEVLVNLLSGRQLTKAVIAANAVGQFRLSLLLSQICNQQMREQFLNQVEYWESARGSEMGEHVHQLYLLLSGQIESLTFSYGEYDWLRALSMFFWYGELSNTPNYVQNALYSYSHSSLYSSHPPTPYFSSLKGKHNDNNSKRGEWENKDVLYELMQLYSDEQYSVWEALDPLNYSAYSLDYSIAWHLFTLLHALLPSDSRFLLDQDKFNQISVGYASQLEQVGQYQWAIYVLTHIPHEQHRQRAIQHFLDRSASRFHEEPMTLQAFTTFAKTEKFLCDVLSIPEASVYQAKAYYAGYRRHYLAEMECLLKADAVNDAHRVFVDHLASYSVVQYHVGLSRFLVKDLAELPKLLTELAAKSLEGACQIYFQYFRRLGLISDELVAEYASYQPMLTRLLPPAELTSLVEKRLSSLQKLPHLHERLCLSDIPTTVADVLKFDSQPIKQVARPVPTAAQFSYLNKKCSQNTIAELLS